jgi:hypothetical protein
VFSRARKIRCDSIRPICNNCVRRSNTCVYDAAPKRRGPDKRPGTRQRSCKKRPADGSVPPPPSKRKRTAPAGDTYTSTPQVRTTKKISPATSSPVEEKYGIGMSQAAGPSRGDSAASSLLGVVPHEVIKVNLPNSCVYLVLMFRLIRRENSPRQLNITHL